MTSVRVGQETVNGEEFRQTYGLASSCFILQKYDGKLRITTRGVGHGLGLSQYTANEMAKEGKDAAEILQYFLREPRSGRWQKSLQIPRIQNNAPCFWQKYSQR